MELNFYSIVILLTLIFLSSEYSALNHVTMRVTNQSCHVQNRNSGYVSREQSDREQRGKKGHNIIVCPPPSHPDERTGHFYSIHTAGVAKLHLRLRLQLSDFLIKQRPWVCHPSTHLVYLSEWTGGKCTNDESCECIITTDSWRIHCEGVNMSEES